MDAWQDRALCRGRGDLTFNPEREQECKALCSQCPVRLECLQAGVERQAAEGIWGGLNFAERLVRCPICLDPKPPSALGCSLSHELRTIAFQLEREWSGDEDYSVTRRTVIHARTNPDCLVPHGRHHGTAAGYVKGCRCREGLELLQMARGTVPATRRRSCRLR